MHRTLRHCRVLITLLGAGIALNLAMTWGIAAFGASNGELQSIGMSSPSYPTWHWDYLESWGATCIEAKADASPHSSETKRQLADYYDYQSGSLPGWVQLGDPAAVTDGCEVRSVAFGWPLRAMHWEWRLGCESASAWSLRSGIALRPVAAFTPRALPTGMLWMGFIANALVFAAGLGLGLYLVVWARRRHRLARGECPFCGFPAGQGAICTECGRARSGANVRTAT